MEYALQCGARDQSFLRSAVAVVAGSLLLSLSACVQIPLFFTPVPLVIQNSVAVALGAVLGARKGFAAIALFLTYGSLGFPVFAGEGGLGILLSPLSGGYLAGYALAALATGKIRELRPSFLLPAVILGHVLILLVGSGVLGLFMGRDLAWQWGLMPFIGLDLVKSIAAYKLALYGRRYWL